MRAHQEQSVNIEPRPARLTRPAPEPRLLVLQRQAGNRAVSSHLVAQRDDGDGQQPQSTGPMCRLDTSAGTVDNLPIPVAIDQMRGSLSEVASKLDQMRGEHTLLKQYRDEHWFVGGVVDIAGGATMPELSIWEPVDTDLMDARAAADDQDPVGLATDLARAAEHYEKAREEYLQYKEAMETGGDRTISALKVVVKGCEITFEVAATIETGGAAGAAIKAVVGTAAEAGTQEAEKGAVDWQKLLTEKAEDFVADMLFDLTAGALLKDVSEPLEEAIKEQAEAAGYASTFGGKVLADRIKLVLAKLTEGALNEAMTFAVNGLWESINGSPESPEAKDPHEAARKVGEGPGVVARAMELLAEALNEGALTGAR